MAEMKKVEAKKVDVKIVKVTKAEIFDSHNVAITLFDKLEEAGIPIIHEFPFGRVKSGTLTSKEDIENDCYVYEWKA